MMKEKDIRTFIPFLVVFVSTFFLSGADMFEPFPSLVSVVKGNDKLMMLLVGSFLFVGIVSLALSIVFFNAWRKLRHRNVWYQDLLWQISGMFFCIFILKVVLVWGVYQRYLWIQGMTFMFVGIFGLYFFNTVFAARKLLYNPPTNEETQTKVKKFDELIKLLKQ